MCIIKFYPFNDNYLASHRDVTIFMSYQSRILQHFYTLEFSITRLEKSAVVIRLLIRFEPLSIYDWLLPLLLNVLHGW